MGCRKGRGPLTVALGASFLLPLFFSPGFFPFSLQGNQTESRQMFGAPILTRSGILFSRLKSNQRRFLSNPCLLAGLCLRKASDDFTYLVGVFFFARGL